MVKIWMFNFQDTFLKEVKSILFWTVPCKVLKQTASAGPSGHLDSRPSRVHCLWPPSSWDAWAFPVSPLSLKAAPPPVLVLRADGPVSVSFPGESSAGW